MTSLKKNTRSTRIIGQHAFLSPSNYHWLNYDTEKLRQVYFQKQQAALGDKYHAYAQQAIELKLQQPDNGTTISMYINDAIGFRMEPEVPLYYSDDCFGTADAVGFYPEHGLLRISDLKTGITPTSMTQLKIYAALFCYEWNCNPLDLHFILAIYQNDAVLVEEPDPAEILQVMSQVKAQADYIAYLREED